ncbi:MAG: winged helix-turn-helix transcriptional regulator [Kiritimatiellae bacterium]|nr:winged helix-turn-helix transcriptional regulator [Kiritimatiellia bacterium]
MAEFAKRSGADFLSFEGRPPRPGITGRHQLEAFAERYAVLLGGPVPAFRNWTEAFHHLAAAIRDNRRTVVLLDEISWMGGGSPDFPGDLKTAWDEEFKAHPHLVVVLCGSVSAWISDNILHGTGFAGRRSLDLVLGELPLADCVKFWGAAAERVPAGEMLDVLSVTGGVPRYLEEINPAESADENVRRLCFLPGGILHDDLPQIFGDVFGKSSAARRGILSALAAGPKSAEEMARASGRVSNGHLTRALEELEEAGFIASSGGINPETGRASGIKKYRIRDNYSRFFLRCVEPNLAAIDAGSFRFRSLEQLPGWETMLGLQFEALVLNHAAEFFPGLGLDRSLVLSAAPWSKATGEGRRGCQIDLLVQTRRSAMVVEIKRRREIGREVIDEVERKVAALKVRKGVAIRTALVYAGRLSPGVEADGYFDAVVSAEDFFRQ